MGMPQNTCMRQWRWMEWENLLMGIRTTIVRSKVTDLRCKLRSQQCRNRTSVHTYLLCVFEMLWGSCFWVYSRDLRALFWDDTLKHLPVILLGYVKNILSLCCRATLYLSSIVDLWCSYRGVKTGHELIDDCVLTGIHYEQCSFLCPFPLIGKVFGNPEAVRCWFLSCLSSYPALTQL